MRLRDRMFKIDSIVNLNKLRRHLHNRGEPLLRDLAYEYHNICIGYLFIFDGKVWIADSSEIAHPSYKGITDIKKYLSAGLSPCRLP